MTNSETVERFVAAWNQMDWDTVVGLLTDDVVYHNIPMDPVHGKEAAAAVIRSMNPLAVDWQIVSIAESGNKVLTERVDNFTMPGGKHVSIPVMGTFEISGGRIKAWRDYFDLATFTGQIAQG